ncbi:MBL fold metallo-hydrolase [Amycolatopsis jiangsuensis]|uniref:Glyoxylase-like metal-dependent hydrolase (Beta-lactamase superfamily II) n=1 Tax=Amycolatopsis jiangsuensis TaxID=1181879 RepID=A0A840J7W8_9PSEU|nr:MBL fold metallo-hydrolase [Amycolatopsis jiangsuensis]MBB4689477.1 glyoxylase-like metal-dependent hydrolase (beta-lactamase superfamily II) [Amycolatopsis jiangsuensis]
MTWIEVADGVRARRYGELDLTTGLVLGTRRCLVIDTRGDVDQGAELAAAVREVTDLPWTVVYTHAHFDHAFGTTPFLPCDVWAQAGCLTELVEHGEAAKRDQAARYREEGKPELAEALGRTGIMPPDRLVQEHADLDLGGRTVALRHPGPGHTDHDLLVHVPDAGVVFAGDLVEHGPHGFTADSFGPDAHLAEWPAALDALLALAPRIVVPGHGDPVDAAFVRQHRDGLSTLAALRAADATPAEAIAASPYPADVTRAALALR